MNPPSHNIYNVKGKSDSSPPDSAAPTPSGSSTFWADTHRRFRLQTLLFVMTVVVSAILVAGVTINYYLKLNKSRQDARPLRRAAGRAESPLRFEMDAQSMYLLEDLLPPAPSEESENMSLSASALKQASYHLVRAEKADKQDRTEEALESYRKVVRIFPHILGVQRQIGMLAIRVKDYALAAEALEKASREDPMTFSMANNLGVAYMGMENFDKAEAAFKTAMQLNPDYAMAYFNLATLYLRRGKPDAASPFLEKYLTLQPGDTMAGQTYALTLIQLEQWDRAAALLQQIARAAPDVAPIHFRLAQALSHGPGPEPAIEALKRAVNLVDPKQALAWLSRPEFNLLRDEAGFQQILQELGVQD